jgi:hypothetical protein
VAPRVGERIRECPASPSRGTHFDKTIFFDAAVRTSRPLASSVAVFTSDRERPRHRWCLEHRSQLHLVTRQRRPLRLGAEGDVPEPDLNAAKHMRDDLRLTLQIDGVRGLAH